MHVLYSFGRVLSSSGGNGLCGYLSLATTEGAEHRVQHGCASSMRINMEKAVPKTAAACQACLSAWEGRSYVRSIVEGDLVEVGSSLASS